MFAIVVLKLNLFEMRPGPVSRLSDNIHAAMRQLTTYN